MEPKSQKCVTEPTFCKRCGYNLRSLPLRHVCPECGNEYDLSRKRRVGVFEPDEAVFPWNDAVASALCLGVVALSAMGSAVTKSTTVLFITVFYIALTIATGSRAVRSLRTFIQARTTLHRIEQSQRADDPREG